MCKRASKTSQETGIKYQVCRQALGTAVKTLHRRPTCHVRVACLSPSSSTSCSIHDGKQQMMAQVFGSLRGTLNEELTPGFSLVVADMWRENQRAEEFCLSFALSLCHPNSVRMDTL